MITVTTIFLISTKKFLLRIYYQVEKLYQVFYIKVRLLPIMSSTNSQTIEKLNRNNYSTWKIMIKMILINKELWSIVNKEKVRPGKNIIPAEQLNWKTQADKVMATIILSISKYELVNIN